MHHCDPEIVLIYVFEFSFRKERPKRFLWKKDFIKDFVFIILNEFVNR